MSMLRYFANAVPGKAQKRSRSAEEVKISKKRYESKRERRFLESWRTGRPWLRYSKESKNMFCDWCLSSGKDQDSSFVKGCANLKIDSIKQHESSKLHVSLQIKNSVPVESSKAAQCVFKLKQADYDKLSLKFRNAHFVAKHHKSYCEYELLCQLDKAKGLDIGTSYINDKYCAKFVDCIASVTLDSVLSNLQSAPYFSFKCDGSADFTGEDFESIYVRTCTNGIVKDEFFNIGVPDSGSASDIHSFVTDAFTTAGLGREFQSKLIGFCSDGAANMQGKKGGLAAILKQTRPYLISVRCLAHRLELAFKDTVKQSKLCDRAFTLLLGLYYLYRKSPKLKQGLKRSFQSLGARQVLPTQVGGTRLMPHLLRAIDNFFKAYVPIRNHLESASHENSKAEGLAKMARDGHVIVFLLSLKELLKPMVRLSLCLQKENLTLADASTHLVVTKSVLEKLCTEEKESIREVFDKSVFMDSDVTFSGKSSKITMKLQDLTSTILRHIETRFPDSSDVLQATEISNMRNWPVHNLTDYGNEQLSVVVDHFSSVLTTEKSEILEEWQILKAPMSEKFGKELVAGDLQWSDVWRAFRNQGVDKVLLVIDLLRTLPPTSVRNECAFSVMKLTKTRHRGRLSAKSLNNLLTVSLQADSVQDFQPRPAIEKFMVPTSGRTRRFAGYTKKSSETATSTSPVLESASPVHVIDECEDEAALSSQVMSYQKMYDGDDDYDTEDEWSDEDEENERTEKEIENLIFMYSRE